MCSFGQGPLGAVRVRDAAGDAAEERHFRVPLGRSPPFPGQAVGRHGARIDPLPIGLPGTSSLLEQEALPYDATHRARLVLAGSALECPEALYPRLVEAALLVARVRALAMALHIPNLFAVVLVLLNKLRVCDVPDAVDGRRWPTVGVVPLAVKLVLYVCKLRGCYL